MEKNLSYARRNTCNLIFSTGLRVFRPLLFSLFFLIFSFVSGQVKKDSVKSGAVISVYNGAAIYSLDESFNTQLLNSKVVTNGKTKVGENAHNIKSVTVEGVQKKIKSKNTIKESVEQAEQEKKEENQKKIQKHLDTIDGKVRKQVFISPDPVDNFGTKPLSYDSYALSNNSVDHTQPGCQQSYPAGISTYIFWNDFIIYFYNNQPLGFSFNGDFSVRPPPGA